MNIQEAVMQLMLAVITGLIGLVTAKITKYFKEKGILAKFEAKKTSVDIAVNAVEQIYYNEDGVVRYQNAKQRATDILNDQGIKITDDELNTLIEASVMAMKNSYEQER